MGLHFSTVVTWLVLLLNIQLFRVHSPSSASSILSSTWSSSHRVDTSPHPAASSTRSDNLKDGSTLRVATANLLGLKSLPRTVGRGLNPPSMLKLYQTQLPRQSSLPTDVDGSFHHNDVQPSVENSRRGVRYTNGLEVRLVSSNPKVSELVRKKESPWQQERPPLDMDYERGSRRSSRKTARNKKKTQQRHLKRKGDDSNQCRRHRLFVDFREMGWGNWILSPKGYEVYYCDGECNFPLATHMNSTNHAAVQTLANSFSPRAVPKACCVPTELSSLRMLYINEWNQLTDKIYHDMVVEACGCR